MLAGRPAMRPAPTQCRYIAAPLLIKRGRTRRHVAVTHSSSPSISDPAEREQDASAAKDPATNGNVLHELGRLMHDWNSGYHSKHAEYDGELTEIEGSIPETLRGTLFRNGPGQFERGRQAYAHILDGDGYITKFTFGEDNRVFFSSRFVHTKERKEEEAANAVLYRSAFGTQRRGGPARNAFNFHIRNPANTNALVWGGRLLALWEAGPPYELDPGSLQTLNGPNSLGGWINVGMAPSSTGIPELDRLLGYGEGCTAHPHVVMASESGESDRLVIWKWRGEFGVKSSWRVHMEIAEFDPQWRRLSTRLVKMNRGFNNSHDFAISASSYLFFQCSSHFDMLAYFLGRKSVAQCVEIRERPARIHIFDRHSSAVQVITTEPCCMLHNANAWDEGTETVVWNTGWGPKQLSSLRNDSHQIGRLKLAHFGDYAAMPCMSLWQHRLDRDTGQVKMEALYDGNSCDFPVVNPRFYSRRSRLVYFTAATQAKGASAPLQAFARLDSETGKLQTWNAGPRSFCGELVFAPVGDPAREDSGYLLGLVNDAESGRSSLVVMDAADFLKGPVARIWLKHPLPHGLHGTFTQEQYPIPESTKGAKGPNKRQPSMTPLQH